MNPTSRNLPIIRKALIEMMGRLNICSKEFVSAQYDHNVQGSAVLGPVQGQGRVCARKQLLVVPSLNSKRAAVLSQGLGATLFSDIDTHHMARSGPWIVPYVMRLRRVVILITWRSARQYLLVFFG